MIEIPKAGEIILIGEEFNVAISENVRDRQLHISILAKKAEVIDKVPLTRKLDLLTDKVFETFTIEAVGQRQERNSEKKFPVTEQLIENIFPTNKKGDRKARAKLIECLNNGTFADFLIRAKPLMTTPHQQQQWIALSNTYRREMQSDGATS